MGTLKCVELLVVLAGLGLLWVFYRKKTNQIMLAVAATITIGGLIRLFNLKDNAQTFQTIAFILAVMGMIWAASWLSNRSATRRRRATRIDPAPGSRGRDA